VLFRSLAKSTDIHDPAIVRLFAERHARPFVDPAWSDSRRDGGSLIERE